MEQVAVLSSTEIVWGMALFVFLVFIYPVLRVLACRSKNTVDDSIVKYLGMLAKTAFRVITQRSKRGDR